MGVVWALVYGLAGLVLGLLVFSAIGLPPSIALAGAGLIASYGLYLGSTV